MLTLATIAPYTAPRRTRLLSDALGLLGMLAAVAAIVWLANSGMERIRDGLAAELFEQQRDIAALELTLGRAEAILRDATLSEPLRGDSKAALAVVSTALVNMRRAYTFDSVEGASAAHALVYPALLDVERWTTEGVSGYAVSDPMVWRLAHRRIAESVTAVRSLRAEVTERARQLLAEESAQVERLRFHLVIAIAALGLLGGGFLLAVMRQRDAQGRAARERGRLLDGLNNVPHGVALFDPDDRLVIANDQFASLFPGDSARLIPGESFASVNDSIEQARRAHADDTAWSDEALAPRASAGPVLAACPDGRFVQIETRPTHEGGTVVVQSDVTLQRRTEQQLRHLATHDALTGLPGRRHFDERLNQALHAAQREGRAVTLMCIDVDSFKSLNDRFGHPAGDTVLVKVAERLALSVRDHDIVARLGGDEFAVVMQNTLSRAEAMVTCERIVSNVAEPIVTAAGIVSQTVSVGVASYPHDALASDALVRAADDACYQAKRAGRNRYCFFRGA